MYSNIMQVYFTSIGSPFCKYNIYPKSKHDIWGTFGLVIYTPNPAYDIIALVKEFKPNTLLEKIISLKLTQLIT